MKRSFFQPYVVADVHLTAHGPMWWRVAGYLAALLPVLFVVLSFSMLDSAKLQSPADWNSVFIQAETARRTGDIDKARSLYVHVGRVAFWYRDWAGVLAGACGLKKISRKKSDHAVRGMLVQAMIAAEINQSRAGIGAVASALKSLGEDKGAVMAILRIRPQWPETEIKLNAAGNCWQP